jgi:hypothetical protein
MTAFDDGWHDAEDKLGHYRLMVRMLSEVSDLELSDYWHGWHSGQKHLRETTKKRKPRK